MAPTWLTSVAWAYLSLCFICAGIIAYDIAVNRRRQPLGVMNAVYPITALYLGPFALAFLPAMGAHRRPNHDGARIRESSTGGQAVVGHDGYGSKPLRFRVRPW